QGHQGGPGSSALPQPDAEEHGRRAETLQESAGAGAESRPAASVAASGVSGGCDRPEQDSGQAVPRQRDRGTDRSVGPREVRNGNPLRARSVSDGSSVPLANARALID